MKAHSTQVAPLTLSFRWNSPHPLTLTPPSRTLSSTAARCSPVKVRGGWRGGRCRRSPPSLQEHHLQANKEAACYRHKVIKFWDSISLVFSKDHATGTGARTTAESAAEIGAENVNNVNSESAATSSTQAGEEHKRKMYRSDDSVVTMLGEKLDNFTSAYKADIAQTAPLEKTSSPEVILDALNALMAWMTTTY